MMHDPIADFLSSLQNAQRAGLASVTVPASQFKLAIAEKLKTAGYLRSITKKGKKIKKYLELELVYNDQREPRVQAVRRVSKPSRRVYHSLRDIRSVRQGRGVAVYSTPLGILTDKEAKQAKVGGEILFTLH